MKKVLFLFVALVAFSFTTISCSNDDEGGVNSSDLIGKWEYSQEGEVVNGQEVLEPYLHAAGCSKDYVEFLSNGTAADVSYYDNGQDPCTEDTLTTTWSVSGNNINISVLGVNYSAQVITLNATTLKVRDTDEDGTYVTVYTKIN
uniref:lipocalin family protein n=1 Tax=Flavobacterium sp. TaxID=239 RepID=UPI00404A4A1C